MGTEATRAVLLWIAGVVVAVGASTTAVRLAADSVSTPTPIAVASSTPSPDHVALPASPAPTSSPQPSAAPSAPTEGTTGPSGAGAISSADTSGRTDDGSPSPAAAGAPTTDPTNGPGDSPPPSSAPSPNDDPTEPDDDPSEPDDDPSESDDDATGVAHETASSTGGTARFRFEGGDVSLVWTSPSAGFSVDVEEDGDSVRVTFVSEDHESRIDADWEDGRPRVRVREDAD